MPAWRVRGAAIAATGTTTALFVLLLGYNRADQRATAAATAEAMRERDERIDRLDLMVATLSVQAARDRRDRARERGEDTAALDVAVAAGLARERAATDSAAASAADAAAARRETAAANADLAQYVRQTTPQLEELVRENTALRQARQQDGITIADLRAELALAQADVQHGSTDREDGPPLVQPAPATPAPGTPGPATPTPAPAPAPVP